MAEVGAEYADIEATAVPKANHRLGIELIGKAEARRKCFISILDVSIRAHTTEAGDSDHALLQVSETTVALGVDSFGEVDFPPEAVGHREFGADAPGVLTVEEPALLAFRCTSARADVALEESDVAEKECGQRKAIGSLIGSISGIERQQTGAVLIAGEAQVFGIADVAAKLEGVVALGTCPVVYKLELLLVLLQGAIAAGDVQTVAEVRWAAVAGKKEARETAGYGRADDSLGAICA